MMIGALCEERDARHEGKGRDEILKMKTAPDRVAFGVAGPVRERGDHLDALSLVESVDSHGSSPSCSFPGSGLRVIA